MAPVSKPTATATWVRRPSRYLEEGGSLEGSSSGEEVQPRRKPSRARGSEGSEKRRVTRSRGEAIEKRRRAPSFAASDACSSVNGRSYVDPWDMENYSFLRRQLEEVSISDNDVSSTPALESTQSDFYYVPLDGDGSPQYQYKHYVDSNTFRDVGTSPVIFRDDTCGRVAGVDEHHFYNDYLDPHQHNMYGSYAEHNVVNNNPSRQSERSRYNNQDYHTYTPPSIVKDLPERYPSRNTTMERKYRSSQRPRASRSYSELNLTRDIYSTREERRSEVWTETMDNRRELFAEKATINRRQSFQEVPQTGDRRRRSTLDDQFEERIKRTQNEKINRRKSIHEILLRTPSVTPVSDVVETKLRRRMSRKSVLEATQSFDNLIQDGHKERRSPWGPNSQPDSLVYVYETGRQKRKMVLPNTEIYSRNYRSPESDSDETPPTVRSDTYSMRPLGRYAMTNYGHLKIDYSCSWNNLHRYITDKVRG